MKDQAVFDFIQNAEPELFTKWIKSILTGNDEDPILKINVQEDDRKIFYLINHIPLINPLLLDKLNASLVDLFCGLNLNSGNLTLLRNIVQIFSYSKPVSHKRKLFELLLSQRFLLIKMQIATEIHFTLLNVLIELDASNSLDWDSIFNRKTVISHHLEYLQSEFSYKIAHCDEDGFFNLINSSLKMANDGAISRNQVFDEIILAFDKYLFRLKRFKSILSWLYSCRFKESVFKDILLSFKPFLYDWVNNYLDYRNEKDKYALILKDAVTSDLTAFANPTNIVDLINSRAILGWDIKLIRRNVNLIKWNMKDYGKVLNNDDAIAFYCDYSENYEISENAHCFLSTKLRNEPFRKTKIEDEATIELLEQIFNETESGVNKTMAASNY
jgi:hypothetical protein